MDGVRAGHVRTDLCPRWSGAATNGRQTAGSSLGGGRGEDRIYIPEQDRNGTRPCDDMTRLGDEGLWVPVTVEVPVGTET